MSDVAEAQRGGVQSDTLADYQTIDFGTGSPLRQELLSRVEREAAQEEIALSDIADGFPAYFTPEMKAWYQDHVQFHRAPALEGLKKRFAADKAHGGAPTCIIEAERQRAEDEYHQERRRLRQQYLETRDVDLKKLDALGKDVVQAQASFANLQADLGREPTRYHPVLYALVLVAIGFAELLINFEAFESLPWASPFVATGLTGAVAVAIAAAAHFHGKVLKQFRVYFEDHIDAKTRQSGLHRLWGGAVLLVVALCAVYYARDTYLTQGFLVDASLGGSAGSTFTKLWTIGGSLFGNLIVYLLGGYVAFQMHDENPLFPELKKSLSRLAREQDALDRELTTAKIQAMKAADSRRKNRHAELDRREQAQKAAPQYAENRQRFEALSGQDARVLGALDAYRIALCQKIRGRSTPFLRRDDTDPDIIVHRMTPAEYLQLGLALKYN